MKRWHDSEPVGTFVIGTFALTIVAGLCAFRIGGDETFESPGALPFLLMAIWSPNIMAVLIRHRQGRLRELLAPLLGRGSVSAWGIALLPVVAAFCVWLAVGAPTPEPIGGGTLGALFLMNLIMGPTGEELGWRGFLLPVLVDRHGWLLSAAIVGGVWALWHLPLWFLPSPHAEIHFGIFAATVVAFSLVMTAAWRAGSGALGPIILFHLAANVTVGWLELTGISTAPTIYALALPFYTVAAVFFVWREHD